VFAIDADSDESRGDGGNTSRTGPDAADPVSRNPREARQRALLDLVKSDPAVLEAAWASPAPFSHSNEARDVRIQGRRIRYSLARCTDEFAKVMGIAITRGRWFSAEDQGAPYDAYVISEAMARGLFDDGDPIGKDINADRSRDDGPDRGRERRVVGVMKAFRQEGELDGNQNYALVRLDYGSDVMRRVGNLALLMKPGSDASVEARIAKSLETAAPDWSFKIAPLALGAEFNRRLYMAPVGLAGVVAGFLIVMVALGLSGVLWQSVTTRIREIGVRRALGASAGAVRAQIVGELLTMTTIAAVCGAAVVLQFPFLDLLGGVSRGTFLGGLSLTIVSLYALAVGCALQPARLATTVHPAEALRYE
jgi:putative ABC transport system permease protein